MGELQQRVSAREFAEYQAYAAIAPWPQDRHDANAVYSRMATAGAAGAQVRWDDCRLWWSWDREEASAWASLDLERVNRPWQLVSERMALGLRRPKRVERPGATPSDAAMEATLRAAAKAAKEKRAAE